MQGGSEALLTELLRPPRVTLENVSEPQGALELRLGSTGSAEGPVQRDMLEPMRKIFDRAI